MHYCLLIARDLLSQAQMHGSHSDNSIIGFEKSGELPPSIPGQPAITVPGPIAAMLVIHHGGIQPFALFSSCDYDMSA